MSDNEKKQVARAPVQASNIKKGHFAMLGGRPCKIAEVKTSKTGKHGHAKANITGICILTSAKKNEVHPASHSITGFTPERTEYQVIGIEGNVLDCLDSDNHTLQFQFKEDDENGVAKELVAAFKTNEAANGDKDFIVTILRAPVEVGDNQFVDNELVESFKEAKEGK